jgi:GNAT superfamily N-acetyltransferase
MLIREAVVADAAAIAKVGVDTWRSAYRGIMPDERLEALSYERATERNRQRLEGGESGSLWLVAESGEEVVGFASAGPAREEEAPGMGEVYGIYVLEAHQRKGIGRMLMEKAVRRLLAGGMRSLVVWVLKEGPARGFYERLGGQLLGSKIITTGGCELEAVSYGWPDMAVLVEAAGGRR